MPRLDLHIPTGHSKDSLASIRAIAAWSDAPSALELGSVYTEAPGFDGTATGLVQAAGAGRMSGHAPNPIWLMTPGLAKPRKVLR